MYRVHKGVHVVILGLIMLGAGGLFAATAPAPYTGKVFLGADVGQITLPADERYASKYGFKVTGLSTMSTAEKIGLQVGDIIVSINDQVWASDKIRLSYSLQTQGRQARPGDAARFTILRADPKAPDGRKKLLQLDGVLLGYPFTQAETPKTPSNDELRPDLKDTRPAYQDLCWALVKAFGYEADTLDLLDRIRRCQEYPDPHRLPIVRYVHRDPFKLEAITRELVSPFLSREGRGAADIPMFLSRAEHVLLRFDADSKKLPAIPPGTGALPSYIGKGLDAHLDYVEAVLQCAAKHCTNAFAALTPEEIAYIRKHRQGMLDSFIAHHMLSYEKDYARQRSNAEVIRLAKKVDVASLVAQARVAALLVAPEFSSSLRTAAEASGKPLEQAVIVERQTPFGAILVAGRGRSRYEKKNYAALYELGGNDVYSNNSASSVYDAIPTSILVDYAGDDAYESTSSFRQGCGDMGVGLLVDLNGNDNYIGVTYAQGVGFMGIGMLCDEDGDDTYRGMTYSQGVGHWGAGMLIDRRGRDRYETHMASQAVGLPGGCGILYDGGAEGDYYYCKGMQQSAYGTEGIFGGWGQGMGSGYRPYASGGVGVLFDRGGSDRFEAGNFSQGGGYFYAFGILYNAGTENDVYIGSRYNQGFCAHQAAGAFIEEGGNDHYMTRNFVAQGLSWDETSVLFLDQAGDDRYEGGSFSQGASAQNGFMIFIDKQGRDTYLYTDQALSGGNQYHGGKSLSFFLDLGGDEDSYPKKRNNVILNGGANSIFGDLPGSVQDARKDEAWKALLEPKAK